MKIDVIDVIEQEDGGAILNLDLDEEAVKFLVQHAVLDILTQAANRDLTDDELLTKYRMEFDKAEDKSEE